MYWSSAPTQTTPLFAVFAGVTTLMVAQTATGLPIPPSQAHGPIFELANPYDGRCLTIDDHHNAEMWACRGSTDQMFLLDDQGRIRSLANQECLDVPTRNGNLYSYPCHDGANQKWDLHGNETLRDRANHQCMDIAGNQSGDDANVWMYDCHGGNNQRFQIRDSTNFRLVTAHNGKCLERDPHGSNARVWSCLPGDNRNWRFDAQSRLRTEWSDECLDALGSHANLYTFGCHDGQNQKWDISNGLLRERSRGECADIFAFSHDEGANVNTWTCGSTSNQLWDVQVQKGSFQLKLAYGGKCMAVEDDGNVVSRSCDGSQRQRFFYNADGRIMSVHNDRCLDASSSYGNLYTYACHGGANQKWDLLSNGGIRERERGECIDLFAFNQNEGANLQMYGCNGAENQRWQMNHAAFRDMPNSISAALRAKGLPADRLAALESFALRYGTFLNAQYMVDLDDPDHLVRIYGTLAPRDIANNTPLSGLVQASLSLAEQMGMQIPAPFELTVDQDSGVFSVNFDVQVFDGWIALPAAPVLGTEYRHKTLHFTASATRNINGDVALEVGAYGEGFVKPTAHDAWLAVVPSLSTDGPSVTFGGAIKGQCAFEPNSGTRLDSCNQSWNLFDKGIIYADVEYNSEGGPKIGELKLTYEGGSITGVEGGIENGRLLAFGQALRFRGHGSTNVSDPRNWNIMGSASFMGFDYFTYGKVSLDALGPFSGDISGMRGINIDTFALELSGTETMRISPTSFSRKVHARACVTVVQDACGSACSSIPLIGKFCEWTCNQVIRDSCLTLADHEVGSDGRVCASFPAPVGHQCFSL